MAMQGTGPDRAGPADSLLRARSALLCPPPGTRRLGPAALRAALLDLHELWLCSRAATVGIGPGTVLMAVGGLARRELVPHGDLDLLLVHNAAGPGSDPAAVARIGELLWGPLRDAGIGVDHSVRTVGEAVEAAIGDLQTGMGLLDARPVAGDPELAVRLVSAARTAWRASLPTRFGDLAAAAGARWAAAAEVAHRVEPDLNNGHGGLRDIGLLEALATAELADRPGVDVQRARTLILDIRTELHRRSGCARDILDAQDADGFAVDLGWTDRFDLARALSSAAASVVHATDVALRSAPAALSSRSGPTAKHRRISAGRPLADGVVELAGEITLARNVRPARDPSLILRVGATAARIGLPINAVTLCQLADRAPEPHSPWPPETLAELLTLLGSGPGLIDVIEALDRAGLWGRLFPEWGAVRGLPSRNPAHVWTVDRHLIEVCAHTAPLTSRVSRPDLLLLGSLLHDIGKGRHSASHSQRGAMITRQIGRRLGLCPTDVDTLTAMVRHHLLLPHTATRHNPEDPATAHRVVDTLGGDPNLLELMHALAEADARGTGPGTWTAWRAALTRDLVHHCHTVIASTPPPTINRSATTSSVAAPAQ